VVKATVAVWRNRVRIDDACAVALEFHFKRPKKHYLSDGVTLRDDAPLAHTQKPDVDKLVRAVLDALKIGGAIQDDALVTRAVGAKYWTHEEPSALIYISARA